MTKKELFFNIDFSTNNEMLMLQGRLEDYCNEDKNLATIVGLMYSGPMMEQNTVEYYMRDAFFKFLSDMHIMYETRDDIPVGGKYYYTVIEKMMNFIDTYIHTEDTNVYRPCYGVKITVSGNKIKYGRKRFKNEAEMNDGTEYHRDAKYFIDSFREYAKNKMASLKKEK